MRSKDYNGKSYTSSNSDIKIFYDPASFVDSPGIWGLGDVTRPNGFPGSEVNIDLGNSSVTELNDEHKKKLLMHETGHYLGLALQNGASSEATTYIGVFKHSGLSGKYTSNGSLIFYMSDTRLDSWSKD